MTAARYASHDDWLRVYGDVFEGLPERLILDCPNCQSKGLRLEFFAHESDRIGYAMFWCDNCLFGISISRTSVPVGVGFHPIELPVDEFGKIVPEYTIVHPPSSDDPEDFEEVIF